MNKFLEAIWLRRAEEQMHTPETNAREKVGGVGISGKFRPVCIVCETARPRGGFHVCSRCFNKNTQRAREALKARGLER